jgi:hypothetical protein
MWRWPTHFGVAAAESAKCKSALALMRMMDLGDDRERSKAATGDPVGPCAPVALITSRRWAHRCILLLSTDPVAMKETTCKGLTSGPLLSLAA